MRGFLAWTATFFVVTFVLAGIFVPGDLETIWDWISWALIAFVAWVIANQVERAVNERARR
jgi:hypothetical protein